MEKLVCSFSASLKPLSLIWNFPTTYIYLSGWRLRGVSSQRWSCFLIFISCKNKRNIIQKTVLLYLKKYLNKCLRILVNLGLRGAKLKLPEKGRKDLLWLVVFFLHTGNPLKWQNIVLLPPNPPIDDNVPWSNIATYDPVKWFLGNICWLTFCLSLLQEMVDNTKVVVAAV